MAIVNEGKKLIYEKEHSKVKKVNISCGAF